VRIQRAARSDVTPIWSWECGRLNFRTLRDTRSRQDQPLGLTIRHVANPAGFSPRPSTPVSNMKAGLLRTGGSRPVRKTVKPERA
jgi:hypothetical protein